MMTLEEHQARAMLLGLVYDWRDHTYCPVKGNGYPIGTGMLDANTMEPLQPVEASLRRSSWGTYAVGHDMFMTHLNPMLPRKVTDV